MPTRVTQNECFGCVKLAAVVLLAPQDPFYLKKKLQQLRSALGSFSVGQNWISVSEANSVISNIANSSAVSIVWLTTSVFMAAGAPAVQSCGQDVTLFSGFWSTSAFVRLKKAGWQRAAWWPDWYRKYTQSVLPSVVLQRKLTEAFPSCLSG